MNGALYSIVSGSLAASERLEIVTNNLANTSTAGFKAQYLVLRMVPQGTAPDAVGLDGVQPGSTPTVDLRTVTDFAQGPIRESGNPLDAALSGPGFFVVTTPQGERYTRQGQFQLDPAGFLVTAAGHRVQGAGGRDVQLAGGRVEIDANGGITVDGTPSAQLRLVDFAEPGALAPEGSALFVATPDAVAIEQAPGATPTTVIQGAIEAANVDAIKGLIELIDVARGYETYMRAIRQVDETVERAITDVGGA
jgi:flagellar basal-body rod protein FlgF